MDVDTEPVALDTGGALIDVLDPFGKLGPASRGDIASTVSVSIHAFILTFTVFVLLEFTAVVLSGCRIVATAAIVMFLHLGCFVGVRRWDLLL